MKRCRYGSDPASLLEVMRAAQGAFGYLDDVVLAFIAEGLRLPIAAVRSYAAFYPDFVLKPEGRHTCVVCTGAACYANGALLLLSQLEERLHTRAGHTSSDGEVTLLKAHCVGVCNAAPAVMVDGELESSTTSDRTLARLR